MNTTGAVLVAILIASTVITGIFYVIFGQVTVRKLRKKSATKDELGIELVSGWDITSVAQALSVPRSLERKFKNRAFHANADVLYKHTNKFDRVLARIFFWLWVLTGGGLLILSLLFFLGIFD